MWEEDRTGHSPAAALAEVERQRAQLADALRAPRWFVALYVVALLALFVAPGVATRPGHGVDAAAMLATIVFGVSVLNLFDPLVERRAGARLRADRVRAYPSLRAPLAVTTVAVVVGSAVTWIVAEDVSWIASIACGVVVGGLVTLGRWRMAAAVRDDVRRGTVVAR